MFLINTIIDFTLLISKISLINLLEIYGEKLNDIETCVFIENVLCIFRILLVA